MSTATDDPAPVPIAADIWQVLSTYRWRIGAALVCLVIANELRDLFFARVTLRTVSVYAQKVFAHLHALGAGCHARRQIGGLLPGIDRGTNGIAFLLGVGLFTLVPTLIEIALVLAVMLSRYSAILGLHRAHVLAVRRLHPGVYGAPCAVPAPREQA